MTIENEVFAKEWLFLEEWTRQEMAPQVVKRYKEKLDKVLTTEEFVKACHLVFTEDASFPFPSLSQILSKVKKTLRQQAQKEWLLILQHNYNYYQHSLPEGLSAIGYQALSDIGGIRYVAQCAQDQITFLRKDFVAAYESLAADPDSAKLTLPESVAREDCAPLPPALSELSLDSQSKIKELRSRTRQELQNRKALSDEEIA